MGYFCPGLGVSATISVPRTRSTAGGSEFRWTLPGLLLARADLAALERYSLSLSAWALALIVCATLPFVPYTEQYAGETAPREISASPLLRRTHVVLTAVWAATFALVAVICGYVEATGTPSDLLTWVVPVALVVGAFKFNQRYAERASEAVAGAGLPADAGG